MKKGVSNQPKNGVQRGRHLITVTYICFGLYAHRRFQVRQGIGMSDAFESEIYALAYEET